MKITEHIDALQREGKLLAVAATRTELDAPIPTCPDWRMRDLVRHVGGVHRWATGYVGNRHTEMLDVDLDDLVDTWPADDLDLIDWFREGHTRLGPYPRISTSRSGLLHVSARPVAACDVGPPPSSRNGNAPG